MSTEQKKCTISADEIKRVKLLGFLQHKGTNKFNARVITRNGRVTSEEVEVLSNAAKLYGDGHLMLTTRLSFEVSGIDYENIEAFREYIGKAGLFTGGTGPMVRPVVSCKGTTCQYGIYDTYALSNEVHERFYVGYHNIILPHKFKIAVGGCPNNCLKASLNDVGIIGATIPKFNEELCKHCKKCKASAVCPMDACKTIDGKLTIDESKCINCGRCVRHCPFEPFNESISGWKLFIGGRWGKKIAQGQRLSKIFTDKEELLDTIEKVILFFRSEGKAGERLADTVKRIGFEKAEEMIMSNELLERKDEILK